MRKSRFSAMLFLAPAVCIILFWSVFPLLYTLYLSFSRWQLSALGAGLSFVGFGNYLRIFGDSRFWSTIKNTCLFSVAAVSLQYFVGLCLALLLNRPIRFQKFFRVFFMLPMMLTPIAIAHIFRMMLDGTMGPINYLLSHIGLEGIPWLTHRGYAMLSVIALDTWEWTPFVTILLLAGLKSIPWECYEAALIDGASDWQTFRWITFPQLFSLSFVVVMIRLVEAFKVFDIIYVLTGGGPGTATESITMYGYVTGLRQFDLGYASAISIGLLIVLIAFGTALLALKSVVEKKIFQTRTPFDEKGALRT